MIRSFRDLEVYQEAYLLMVKVHKILNALPIFEKNDLASQIRRASKSCPANIAEGWAKRRHEKEFKRHLDVAIGSASEKVRRQTLHAAPKSASVRGNKWNMLYCVWRQRGEAWLQKNVVQAIRAQRSFFELLCR
ncbi:MAG: four helix bundle protein [Anaerolineales bacterium]|nr:four helix bundle protein [Anaerolineales bacterium]